MAVAAILAGGQARRLGGRDKSAVRIASETILTRQLRVLSPVVDRVLLVGYTGNQPVPDTVDLIPDRIAASGPLAGLDAAIAAAAGEAVLLIACDMPYVSTELASHLIASAAGVSAWQAFVPRTDRGYHPLCAVYSAACGEVVRDQLERRQLRMLGLLEKLRVWAVEGDELARFGDAAHLLTNVNTDADLAALEALQNH